MKLLQEGQIIRETYEVERFLGEGAFAEVYRVKHRFLGRQAMKIFKTTGMTINETERILGEAILLSRMGHPNIIRVFDADVTETSQGNFGFFTMEYVAGGNLHQFWRSHGRRFVPIETTVEILRQTCRGLTVAHGESPPVIHRDIKPQNILVGYDANGMRIRVTDFGLAKEVNPLTLLASAKGTLCFKAPESIQDPQADSCAGDVWALGTTLYLLLTDQLPYIEAGNTEWQDSRRFNQPLTHPSRLNIQANALLDDIVLRSLAINPNDRYATANEILSDLEGWSFASSERAIDSENNETRISPKNDSEAGSQIDEEKAEQIADNALRLARNTGTLGEAADLMEEAINHCPRLREEYEYQLKLWRRGMVM